MKTKTNSRYAVAVLIDGDNASFEKMEDIMGFVSRYGDAVVRRIYGDWTRKSLSAWKETAREHGFRLVQASSHAPGKNTTDIALVIYWMDFGNARTTGQVLIGNIRGKILQPVSNEYLPIPRMNVITEEVRYSTIKEKDSGPSCSLAEALQKQDLFINSILAQTGCDILWRMLREGRTFYRGAYLNLDTLRINPIPV